MSVRCLVADDHPAASAGGLRLPRDERLDDRRHGAGRRACGCAGCRVPSRRRARRLPHAPPLRCRADRAALDTSPETKIVVYTADADEALVRSALGAGASAVLLKESPLDDLVRAVETSMAGATYVDPALSFGLDATVGTPVLTDRECSVLTLLAEGMSHDEIGAQLSISGETVRTHVRKASKRLGGATRTETVAKALRLGLIA